MLFYPRHDRSNWKYARQTFTANIPGHKGRNTSLRTRWAGRPGSKAKWRNTSRYWRKIVQQEHHIGWHGRQWGWKLYRLEN